jgi:hypothetical protein
MGDRMSAPHVWLKESIEAATGLTVWPVGMTGQGGPPFVIYAREGTSRELLLQDLLGDDPVLDTLPPVSRFTVGIYADDYVQAWGIAESITAAVHKFSGTSYGVADDSCLVTDEKDGQPEYIDGREVPTYVVEQTIEIRWSEA